MSSIGSRIAATVLGAAACLAPVLGAPTNTAGACRIAAARCCPPPPACVVGLPNASVLRSARVVVQGHN